MEGLRGIAEELIYLVLNGMIYQDLERNLDTLLWIKMC